MKSMLAMGWSVDRTKDGESMSQQRESEKMRKISQASQVQYRRAANMNVVVFQPFFYSDKINYEPWL